MSIATRENVPQYTSEEWTVGGNNVRAFKDAAWLIEKLLSDYNEPVLYYLLVIFLKRLFIHTLNWNRIRCIL